MRVIFFLACAMFLNPAIAMPDDDLPPTLMDSVIEMADCLALGTKTDVDACVAKVDADKPNWSILVEPDLMTDQKTVTMMRAFSGGTNISSIQPSLVLSCPNGNLGMMISGNYEAKAGTAQVLMRIDKGEPFNTTWAMRGGKALVTSDPKAIYSLIGASVATIRFSTKEGAVATAQFDVSGFSDAARWLERYCDAYNPPL